MSRDILIDVCGPMTRVALVDGSDIQELYMESPTSEKLVGNIYKGKVQNILPGMQAAFIDIGLNKNAFLYAGDILVDTADFVGMDEKGVEKSLREQPAIRKLLSVGQELLVQVIKEPGGTKGPRVTTHITLPGRTCVMVPTLDYVGVSRRIDSETERARLKAEIEAVKPSGMGVIVRTAAKGLTKDEFRQELEALGGLYERISQRAKDKKAPALIYSDESLAYRVVRDMLTDDIDALVINDRDTFDSAVAIAKLFAPTLAQRIRLYTKELPIFDAYSIENKVKNAIERKVWLKNGGYLVFDQTEALTVIDVNTGKFVGPTSNLQDTVFQLNIEAAREIARQVRLRDISGIIIIDFIDMLQENNRKAVVDELRAAFKGDRTKTNVVGLTGLGLVEMTRKKLRKSLSGVTQRPCPLCDGEGRILKAEQVVYSAVRDVQRMRAGGYICDLLIEINKYAVEGMRGIRNLHGVYYIVKDDLGTQQYKVVSVNDPAIIKEAKPLF
ncbi:MAG: Rne/Rng family ribonuclease [Clostridia bacterium]|nr:Rne/Rng family ribonuclease [Clostridia bacterium]